MIKSIYFILLLFGNIYGQTFHLARIQYGGGGDWYCDPSSLPNLLKYLKNNTPISIHDHETRIKLTDDNANQYPYDKKLYYYIKVPKIGLTYNELFKQIDEQSKKYIHDLYYEDHTFIEEIRKQTDVEYCLECGS